jgi:NDP-hexose-3-ketoreductase
MLPVFTGSPDTAVVAIASRDGVKAARWAAGYPACAGVAGYAALLERADVDAVYIALPNSLHAEWAARALEAGKHVLVEKPAATSEAEARALVKMAQARRLVLLENFMFLHHGQHAAVAGLCGQDAIGDIQAFRGCFGVPGLDAANVRYRPELDGGALNDAAVYPIRAARHLLGQELVLIGATLRHDGHVDVGGEILLATPSGITVSASFGFTHNYRSDYELWGSKGRLRLDRAYTPPAAWQPVLDLHWQDREERRGLPADDQVGNAVAHFVACVRGTTAFRYRDIVHQAALVEQVRETAHYVRSSS